MSRVAAKIENMGLSRKFWSYYGPIFHGILDRGDHFFQGKLVRGGTIFFRENWSGGGPFFSGKIGPGGPFFSGNIGPGDHFFQGILVRDHFFQKKLSGRLILSWKIRFYQSFDILDFLILFNCRTTKLFDPGLTIHILVFNTLDGQYSGVQNS